MPIDIIGLGNVVAGVFTSLGSGGRRRKFAAALMRADEVSMIALADDLIAPSQVLDELAAALDRLREKGEPLHPDAVGVMAMTVRLYQAQMADKNKAISKNLLALAAHNDAIADVLTKEDDEGGPN